ncbi:heme anaerobic degradation radical SAM methyltransferase ChuW/HutW [Oxalobacter vibrioformis]|uniref:Heme anaerobic degradation radical SAM methyltransferase ChuW/HutW n=1 Tax=Oxalobacter vibrioformis TaxID=933080 RepID=A0A9E9LZJ4_9BURK|nr:heme anaerobic degradation radical SAM methyltransferase ChuW/HutW [Oxalobacter vibrioformis]WAW10419.1 heme anaerobic degradation radical SAM methyltransferase ChuW/HutW [Oxalobacter vibrioformis]
MIDLSPFLARVSDDPLTLAFEEEKKVMPSLARMRPQMPQWEGGTFAEFAPEAFMARPESPLALYVHVPYCHHHCTFCPFYINQTKKDWSQAYARLLLKEIADTAHVLRDVIHKREVNVVYFGGGTPSDLEKDDLAAVIRSLRETFRFAADAEVTVEGRTTGFTPEKGQAWAAAGANRFSLGVQSANTRLRKKLGRLSSREQVGETLNGLCDSGATVVIDLLYGLPGQDVPLLLDDIRYLSEETPVHGLDLYELRRFPDSPLDKAINRGKMPPIPELADKARMFGAAYQRLADYGFEHFSPKHWRRDGKERSLYNRLARAQTDMIPFGSAGGGRLGAIGLGMARDIKTYTEMVEQGEKPLSRIAISPLAAEEGGFSYVLDESLEILRLPSLREWPASHQEAGEKLLAQWHEAGLILPQDDECGASLTCAGHFWSGRMKKLLLDLVAIPTAA